MKISSISVWQITLPLEHTYWLSGGRLKFEQLDSTFVRIDTDEGLSGYGESCPWGHTYIAAHAEGVRSGIQTLAPSLIGSNPLSLDAINRLMDVQLPGNLAAKSALDMACNDILGKYSNLPLWQLFGGDIPDPVAVNSSIATGNPDEMISRIIDASRRGCKTHSAKIGGSDVKLDIERIEAIEAFLPDDEQVTFDVNRAWLPGTAIMVLNSINSAASWFEQPCETLNQCAEVAKKVRQAIVLDECLYTFEDHFNAAQQGICQAVKIKPGRVGGLTKARKLRDFGLEVGWQMHIEDVGGSSFADTAIIHLASSTPRTNRLASWLAHEHISTNPVHDLNALTNTRGYATPPSIAGIGASPDENMLGEPVAIYR